MTNTNDRFKAGFGYSENALEEVCTALGDRKPVLIVFFSDVKNFAAYALGLHEKYPDSNVIGSTSYIELTSVGFNKNSLAALAIYEGVECACGVIPDIKNDPYERLQTVSDTAALLSSNENCCCLEFMTAFGGCEENVLGVFRNALDKLNIPVFGSSAGTDSGKADTLVSLNGKVYDEACVFALIHNLHGKIKMYRENIFVPTHDYFVATDVDCEERTVYEFDGIPAAQAVAGALGISVKELEGELSTHPMGRMVNGDIYITEHASVEPDDALVYFARINSNTKMALLEPGDVEEIQESTMKRITEETENGAFCIVVNCIGRAKYFETKGIFNNFADRLAKNLPCFIGCSGYGEQLYYEHFNQTMIVAVFA